MNIMSKVIFEQLRYPALSPTRMCLQLAESTIRYPEGIVENLLVWVKNSFILTDVAEPIWIIPAQVRESNPEGSNVLQTV
jgi:hypothetical protein